MTPTKDTLPDRFAGTQPDPVPDGGILTVHYADVDQAKQTVRVVATDRDDSTDAVQLDIPLRGNGKGSALLTVPVGWSGVVLSSEQSEVHAIDVALPP